MGSCVSSYRSGRLVEVLAGRACPAGSAGGSAIPQAVVGQEAPPGLTGGVEFHEWVVGLDWVQGSGPLEMVERVKEWCEGYWGEADLRPGQYFYKRTLRFGTGACLYVEPTLGKQDHAYWCLRLPGSVMAEFKTEEQGQVLRELATMRLKLTRLDVAFDVRGEDLQLRQTLKAACERGELCQLRRFKPIEEFKANGRSCGATLNIGTREGHVVMRAYDKGMEQGGKVPNRWQRIEVEFKKKRAAFAGWMLRQALGLEESSESIVMCEVDDRGISTRSFKSCLVALIFGAVDFRERPGKSRAYSRRPRAEWFRAWLDFFGRIRIQGRGRMAVSLANHVAWWRRCVSPQLKAFAEQMGMGVEGVMRELKLLDGVMPRASAAVKQWKAIMEKGMWVPDPSP